MARTRKRTKTTRRTPRPAPVASAVYVLDAWDDTAQRSVIAVFATRRRAERALARLLARPGDWYAGVVKRSVG